MVTDDSFVTDSPTEGFEEALRRIEEFSGWPRELNLHQLGLTHLPEQLFELTDLTRLNLMFNRLKDLPHEIRYLKQLKVLDLYSNDFETIPVSVTSLRYLEELHLASNRISYIPPGIGRLQSLKTLNLNNNNIRWLPEQVRSLGRLEDLRLQDNPIAKLHLKLPNLPQPMPMQSLVGNFSGLELLDLYFQQHAQPIAFLSYARSDRDIVEEVRKSLQEGGYGTWMDVHDIVGGEEWERAIYRAIENSSLFIAILSKNSVTRRGMVQRELKSALKKLDDFLPSDIFVVPLRLDDSDIPEQLRHFHLVDWNNGEGTEKLLEAIESSLERRSDE